MEGFFDLGPPSPSRLKIVFSIQIHPAELKLTLKGSEVVSLVPRDSGEGTLAVSYTHLTLPTNREV